VNLFETSLPLRLDYEAMLAYLLLPPAGGVLLLVMERKSDYVRYVLSFPGIIHCRMGVGAPLTGSRFHAWQSSMLFASIFVRRPPPRPFSFDSDERADGKIGASPDTLLVDCPLVDAVRDGCLSDWVLELSGLS